MTHLNDDAKRYTQLECCLLSRCHCKVQKFAFGKLEWKFPGAIPCVDLDPDRFGGSGSLSECDATWPIALCSHRQIIYT